MRLFNLKAVSKDIICTALATFLSVVCVTGVLAADREINGTDYDTDYDNGVSSKELHYRPGELLVKFKPGVTERVVQLTGESHGAVEMKGFRRPRQLISSPMDQWRLVRLGTGIETREALERFAEDPDVERVEFNFLYTADQFPNDTYFSEQWALHNTGQTGGSLDADIDALEAWDIQTGSNDVVVAVIDSGVDYTHDELSNNIWTNPGEIADNGVDDDGNGFVDDIHGWDFANDDNDPFDDRGHGTRVTGVIAAKGNNTIGIAGISWNVSIMALKFLNAKGTGYTSDAVESVLYSADMGAQVISNSWGGGDFSGALEDAIITANNAGALFIASAGNDSDDNDDEPHYPSSYDVPNVIAVAATDDEDELSSSSNYGLNSVDLGAPGVAILTTTLDNSYITSSGTSIATPHVAGAAALVMAEFPNLAHLDVKELLLNTVDPVSSLTGIIVTGGRLNVYNALVGTPPVNKPPVAKPNGPYTGVEDIAVVFDGSESSDPNGNPLTYIWDFGDGSTGEGVSPAHSYNCFGTYTVTLVVNDGQVDSELVPTTATIANQPPQADPGGPYVAEVGEIVMFDGSDSFDSCFDTLTYSWDFGDENTGTGVNPTHSYATSGTFNVTLVVNDGTEDSAPMITTATITSPTVNLPPLANAGEDQTVLKSSQVLLDATASTDPDGSIVSYTWQQIDGSPPVTLDNAGEAVASFIAPNVGAKPKVWVFEITVTDNNGATATDQVTVTVTRE